MPFARASFVYLIAAASLAGCSMGAVGGPQATATITGEDVMRTAEAIADSTRAAATPTATRPLVTPTETAPPFTPTPEATSTPSEALVVAAYNANVRSGPGEIFDIIDFILQGEQANAAGRFVNETSGTWWYITRNEQGRAGWVWGGAVTVAGDEATIPFLESPPTPTEGPSPTPTESS